LHVMAIAIRAPVECFVLWRTYLWLPNSYNTPLVFRVWLSQIAALPSQISGIVRFCHWSCRSGFFPRITSIPILRPGSLF
jgi:hypothetical protein